MGQTFRSRYCINPPPSHGGKMCSGGPFEEQQKPCKEAECPGIDILIREIDLNAIISLIRL